ncbi:hypothetical protein D4R71_06255 [bacterium]|nr:MAG: hypothetical protein D4R71_06255 [bacterium]
MFVIRRRKYMSDFSFYPEEIKFICKDLGLTENAFSDEERDKILNHWEDANIVACPGSGKTTVLLAKLLLLSHRMPFDNGKGICVLTHTNVAIDEIKSKLGSKADILFKHPNFFGTIQSFINRFLAIPAYIKKFKYNLKIIDSSRYINELKKRYEYWNYLPKGWLIQKFKDEDNIHKFLYDICFNKEFNLVKKLGGQTIVKDITKSKSYPKIKKFKYKLIEDGYLKYDDAYSLAEWYLTDEKIQEQLSKFFSSRFRYIFIDEMQDTQEHQLEIINKVFRDLVIKQYYGDPDQAIFYGIGGGEMAWDYKKEPKLEITQSKRFGEKIAICLYPFRMLISDVAGNSKDESKRPHIIIYDDPINVLDKFSSLIDDFNLKESKEFKEWDKPSDPFNAVGFVGKKDKDKLTINDYVDGFSKQTSTHKINFSNLISYFQKRPNKEITHEGSKIYYKLFINALLAILDQGNVKIENRYYTKTSLLKYLRENYEEVLIKFNAIVASWIMEIHFNNKTELTMKTEFIKYFKTELKAFFNNFNDGAFRSNFVKNDNIEDVDIISNSGNIKTINGIDIKIGTIHSVKSETHLATLLLETQNDGKLEKDYYFRDDSGNLFCNEIYKRPSSFKLLERRLKTSYVAMSRPTHLLCVAINKERANCSDCDKRNTDNCNWQIINV